MKHRPLNMKSIAARSLAIFVALSWLAVDVGWAAQEKARARGSSASSKSSAKSGSSQSTAKGRSAVSRSSARAKAGSPSVGRGGAASTRSRPRTGSGHGHGHHGSGGRYYGGGYYGGYYGYPGYWHPRWGYWGWGVTIGSGYGHGYGYYPPVEYSSRRSYRMGALDLKVRPKNTEVYVDGQYVGLAKEYDGFPGHLWLERGVYEITFFSPGFENQTRTVKVMTDLILDMEIHMRPGKEAEPAVRFGLDEPMGAPEEAVSERGRGTRGALQARMHLAVEPGQALVYLDGNVLGTGDELAGLHAGLILSAGAHTLEVVHRGFETLEQRITVEAGEEVEYDLKLKPATGQASP